MDVSGVLYMRPPSPHRIRAAVTQAEVTAVSVPVLEGAEVDASFKVAIPLPSCDELHMFDKLQLPVSMCMCRFWRKHTLTRTSRWRPLFLLT